MPSLFTGSYTSRLQNYLTATFFSKTEGFLEQTLLFSSAQQTKKQLFCYCKGSVQPAFQNSNAYSSILSHVLFKSNSRGAQSFAQL